MATFLIRFGYPVQWLMAQDILSFQALYASAIRCWYQDKIQDAEALCSATGTAFGNTLKGSKQSPLEAFLQPWRDLVTKKRD